MLHGRSPGGRLDAIKKAGAEAITIPDLVRKNSRGGSNVKIII